MTSTDITRALATRHWHYSRHICVPRCTLPGWEADLLVLNKSGWMEEVEIKISMSDFRREFEDKTAKHKVLLDGKPELRARGSYFHGTETVPFDSENPRYVATSAYWFEDWTVPVPHLIRRFWFALPEDLAQKALPEVPPHCGVLAIRTEGRFRDITELRAAANLKRARKLTDAERAKLLESTYYRYWRVRVTDPATEGVAGCV